MRVGMNLLLWTTHVTEEHIPLLGKLKKMGYDGVEIPIFEGDAAQMKASLEKLASLPDETQVYPGHEYTQKNLEFAALLEPGNAALARRRAEVESLRAAGRPSVPTTIAIEKATNPFLRTDSPELRESVRRRTGSVSDDPVTVFAAVRKLKDEF